MFDGSKPRCSGKRLAYLKRFHMVTLTRNTVVLFGVLVAVLLVLLATCCSTTI
jgi:hypothetical protein